MLGAHPVRVLLPDDRLGPVDHPRVDLSPAVRGKAVQEHGIRSSQPHQLAGHAEQLGVTSAARLAGRGHLRTGRDRVGPAGSLTRIRDHGDAPTVQCGFAACLLDDRRLLESAIRHGDDDIHARDRARLDEGVGDVRQLADIGEADASQIAEPIAERQDVRERLARIVLVRAGIDHGNARCGCEDLEGVMVGDTSDDHVAVRRQGSRRVLDPLVAPEPKLLRPQHDGQEAETVRSSFERDVDPRGRLLEHTCDGSTTEAVERVQLRLTHPASEIEEITERVRRHPMQAQESLCRLRNRRLQFAAPERISSIVSRMRSHARARPATHPLRCAPVAAPRARGDVRAGRPHATPTRAAST